MGNLLLLVNVFVWTSVSLADICSHLPGYTVHGTSCFKLYTTARTWAAAEASCVAEGGHLASIHSREEQAFVLGLVANSLSDIWIGMVVSLPNMAWSDNTDMDYTALAEREPDSGGCGRLKRATSFLWADLSCANTFHYICRAASAKLVDQTQAYFTLIPDGVPIDAAGVPSSTHTVWSAIECAAKCQQDAQCVHFILSQDGGKYRCETYSSLTRPPTATPPTDNYQKIV